MDDELLDLVDADDKVIGTINRKDYATLLQDKLGYIRSAELFIVNDEGNIWVPIRTADKTIAPNGYDYSVAGHVESGQGYLDTIIRETQEEINLAISQDDVELITKITSERIRYIRSIYILRSNENPNFNPEDFVSAEWLTPAKLIANIDAGHETKSSLREAVVVLQTYLQNI
jgi:isopentenyldiphosphate isomerase